MNEGILILNQFQSKQMQRKTKQIIRLRFSFVKRLAASLLAPHIPHLISSSLHRLRHMTLNTIYTIHTQKIRKVSANDEIINIHIKWKILWTNSNRQFFGYIWRRFFFYDGGFILCPQFLWGMNVNESKINKNNQVVSHRLVK